MRMHMRRFTRLTNGFSKKFESHVHMVALYAVFYDCEPACKFDPCEGVIGAQF